MRASGMFALAVSAALTFAVVPGIGAAQSAHGHQPAQPAAVQPPATLPAPAPTAAARAEQSASAGALAPVQKTDVKDQAAYERLLGNSGITLQWLWSASRGQLNAKDENGVVRLEGTQSNFEGTLKIKGEVVSIGSDRFVLRGTILILDAPDKGRRCERTGDYEFRATGKRVLAHAEDGSLRRSDRLRGRLLLRPQAPARSPA